MEDQREEVATGTQQSNLSLTNGRRWQYSLRTLFVVTTLLAVMLSLLFASPGWVRALSALCWVTAFPAVLATALVYGKGYLRTFCLGTLIPSAWAMFSLAFVFLHVSPYVMDSDDYELQDALADQVVGLAVVSSVMSVLVGLLAIGTRWVIESPQRRRQQPDRNL